MDRRPPTCNENQQFLQQPVGGARLALPLVDSAFTFVIFIGRQFLSFSFFLILSLPPLKVLESFNGLSHGGAPLWLIVAH